MTQHKSNEYGRRVCKAVRLVAEGWEPNVVALQVGVRQGTLRTWMADAEFGTMVDCLRAFGRLQFSRDALGSLRPEALDTLRRVLHDSSGTAAVQAARDVLKWLREFEKEDAEAAKAQEKHTVHVIYHTADGKPVSVSPWADRNPVKPRSFWEDAEGEDD